MNAQDSSLECAICLDGFTKPVVLMCGHSTCRQCLDSIPEKNCPTCRTPFNKCVTNFSLVGMIEAVEQLKCEIAHLKAQLPGASVHNPSGQVLGSAQAQQNEIAAASVRVQKKGPSKKQMYSAPAGLPGISAGSQPAKAASSVPSVTLECPSCTYLNNDAATACAVCGERFGAEKAAPLTSSAKHSGAAINGADLEQDLLNMPSASLPVQAPFTSKGSNLDRKPTKDTSHAAAGGKKAAAAAPVARRVKGVVSSIKALGKYPHGYVYFSRQEAPALFDAAAVDGYVMNRGDGMPTVAICFQKSDFDSLQANGATDNFTSALARRHVTFEYTYNDKFEKWVATHVELE